MFLVRAARFGLVFSGLWRLEICMIQPFKTSVRRMRNNYVQMREGKFAGAG